MPLVLLADDNAGDRRLVELAFAEAEVPCELATVEDGAEALDYLRDREAARPDLVLLDINMPRMGGLELLELMKTDERLRTIPVVMLTTSVSPGDRAQAYARHANAFVRKPVDVDAFFLAMRRLQDFWLATAERP